MCSFSNSGNIVVKLQLHILIEKKKMEVLKHTLVYNAVWKDGAWIGLNSYRRLVKTQVYIWNFEAGRQHYRRHSRKNVEVQCESDC